MHQTWKHQENGILFALKNDGCCALFWEMGTGKTFTALKIFGELRKKTLGLKMLVVCPISLIYGAWGCDIQQFSDYSFCDLHKKFTDKEHDIYIVNFDSFVSQQRISALKELLRGGEWLAVLDESSRIKNFSATTTKNILLIKNLFRYRIVMSGTPAPNDETEYWPQISFIRDKVFHPKFYPFRSYYFHRQRERRGKIEYFSGKITSRDAAREMYSQGWHWAMTDAKRKEMMARIAPYCNYAWKKNCLDLPEQIDETRIIEMGAEQRKAYNSMKNDLVVELENSFVVATVALTKIMKLRQITSSFAIDDAGQNKDIGEKTKLKELQNVLEEAGKQQVIIWCEFRHELAEILKLLGGNAVTLYGETKDRDESITMFKNGTMQYLIAHGKSAGFGLTFINCNLQIFYSLNYSWETYIQCKSRTHRAGQINKCTYIHLLAKDSIDMEIFKVLQNKGNAQEIIYKIIGRLKSENNTNK